MKEQLQPSPHVSLTETASRSAHSDVTDKQKEAADDKLRATVTRDMVISLLENSIKYSQPDEEVGISSGINKAEKMSIILTPSRTGRGFRDRKILNFKLQLQRREKIGDYRINTIH